MRLNILDVKTALMAEAICCAMYEPQLTVELLPTSYEHMGATQYRDSLQWQKVFATKCMSKQLTAEPLPTSYDHSLPLCLAQPYSLVNGLTIANYHTKSEI